MAMENINIRMEAIIKVNGWWELRMDKESINFLMEVLMRGNGKIINNMAEEFW